jgi:leucyl-tRNA synthetase
MVNGKTRATVTISRDASEEAVRTAALALPEVAKWLEGKSPKKVIVVAGKVVSIVV